MQPAYFNQDAPPLYPDPYGNQMGGAQNYGQPNFYNQQPMEMNNMNQPSFGGGPSFQQNGPIYANNNSFNQSAGFGGMDMNGGGNTYDNLRNDAVNQEASRSRKKKIICGVVIALIVIGVILAIVLPIVLTLEHFDLPDGYAFTGNSNCQESVSIAMSWENSGRDLDLNIEEPDGGRTVTSTSRSGNYGSIDRDRTDGPGPETYSGSCVVAGLYKISVKHYSEDDDHSLAGLISASVGGGFTDSKSFCCINEGSTDRVATLVVGQNEEEGLWYYSLE